MYYPPTAAMIGVTERTLADIATSLRAHFATSSATARIELTLLPSDSFNIKWSAYIPGVWSADVDTPDQLAEALRTAAASALAARTATHHTVLESYAR